MKNKPSIPLLILIALFLVLSCAKPPVKKIRKVRKQYHQEVEDDFSKIENDERDILEHYRRLRSQNWKNYKQRNSRLKYKRTKTYRPKTHRPKRVVKKVEPVVTPEPQRVPLAPEQIEELKIEAQQHMNYFCMQKRKSKRFKGEEDCLAFTQDIYSRCQAKNPIHYDRSLVKCVKSQLR